MPPPPLAAETYALHETHPADHVTVAIEPGDLDATRPKTRLDYYHHGLLPLRVIVTNDGDEALTLDDARILFLSADSTTRNAATDEELQRRMFTFKSTKPTTIPLGPLPSITIHHKPVAREILLDEDDFGFKTTAVAPHSTLAGYLFYDVKDFDEPVLDHATLELRKIRVAKDNRALESFVIPLKPSPERPGEKADQQKAGQDTPHDR